MYIACLFGGALTSQLGIDQQLELLEIYHASLPDAVDNKARSRRHPQMFGEREILCHLTVTTLRDAGIKLALIYTLPHFLRWNAG